MLEFEAIGTHWKIEASLDRVLASKVKQRIEVFDKTYSRFRGDSLVSEMAHRVGRFILPIDAAPLLQLYRELYDLTGGAMTPLIGQVLADAGYDDKYSLVTRKLTSPPGWDEAMVSDGTALTIKQPVLLDFGAAGKGYLIDIIGEMLEAAGIMEYTIDAGGDIRHRGGEARIGLEHPEHFEQVIGVVTLGSESICGSAGSRRKWGKFHHVIDPHKLESPKHILALWVVADSTMLADALSTALFFVSPEKLAEKYKFEYLLLYPDFSVKYSKGLKVELFA